MREALAQAQLAAKLGEVPVGAVVVVNGEIISRAHNTVEKQHDASCHAEVLALQEASAKLESWRLVEAALYVTMEPCTMCFGAIVNFRVGELYFGCHDLRHGAVGSLYDLSENLNHIHKLKVYPQLLETPCREIVQEFFRVKRESLNE